MLPVVEVKSFVVKVQDPAGTCCLSEQRPNLFYPFRFVSGQNDCPGYKMHLQLQNAMLSLMLGIMMISTFSRKCSLC